MRSRHVIKGIACYRPDRLRIYQYICYRVVGCRRDRKGLVLTRSDGVGPRGDRAIRVLINGNDREKISRHRLIAIHRDRDRICISGYIPRPISERIAGVSRRRQHHYIVIIIRCLIRALGDSTIGGVNC